MRVADFFLCGAIIGGGPAVSKAEVVGRLLALLARAGHIAPADVPGLRDAVLRRERLGSTGIGQGVAVPHPRSAALTRPLGVLAVCRPPVDFGSLDGEPVDVVALRLAPPDRPGGHLARAARGSEGLFRLLADEAFRRRLRRAGSAVEIERLLRATPGDDE